MGCGSSSAVHVLGEYELVYEAKGAHVRVQSVVWSEGIGKKERLKEVDMNECKKSRKKEVKRSKPGERDGEGVEGLRLRYT